METNLYARSYGDLKAGSGIAGSTTPTICNAAMYQQGLDYLNSLEQAAMLTPGDNDWTDCDRPANGGYNSRERLDYERGLFFGTSHSLGQHPLSQEVQTSPQCLGFSGPTQCVENRRWTVKHVTYATVNVQGSCNNLCDTAPDPGEYAARNVADIAWLNQTFDEAKADGSAAVMIIGQADPGFDLSDATRAPLRDARTLVETDGQQARSNVHPIADAVTAAWPHRAELKQGWSDLLRLSHRFSAGERVRSERVNDRSA